MGDPTGSYRPKRARRAIEADDTRIDDAVGTPRRGVSSDSPTTGARRAATSDWTPQSTSAEAPGDAAIRRAATDYPTVISFVEPTAARSRRAWPAETPTGSVQPTPAASRSVNVHSYCDTDAASSPATSTDSLAAVPPVVPATPPLDAITPATIIAPPSVMAAASAPDSTGPAPIPSGVDPLTATRPLAAPTQRPTVVKQSPTAARRAAPTQTLQPMQAHTTDESTDTDPAQKSAAAQEKTATPATKPSTAHVTPLLDRRSRIMLVAGTVAATLIVVVAIGIVTLSGGQTPVAGQEASATPHSAKAPEPFPSERVMMSATQAQLINPKAQWAEVATQDRFDDASPRPVCVTNRRDGETPPTATMLRTLHSPGDSGATALQVLNNYPTAEEATKIFENRTQQLGACEADPTYIVSGARVTGVGDEAVGVIAAVQNEPQVFHTVVLVRTGTAISLYDVSQTKSAAPIENVVKAAAAATDKQCNAAVGLCSLTPSALAAPPPLGGTNPGFMTPGDLPRVHPGEGVWTLAEAPKADYSFRGTLCEGVSSWRSPKNVADSRGVAYLLNDDSKISSYFGIDQMLLKFTSNAAAATFGSSIKESMKNCASKSLTAKVTDPKTTKAKGNNGKNVEVTTYTVTQATKDGDLKYLTALVVTDNLVSYLVQPVVGKETSLTADQWTSVAVRAGQRATQAS